MKELLKRSLSAILFGAIVVAGTVVLPPLFHLLMAFAIAWTLHEFYAMSIGGKRFLAERILAVLGAELLYAFLVLFKTGTLSDPRLLSLAFVPVLLLMLIPIWAPDHSEHGKLAYIFAGLGYVGYPLALVPLLLYHGGCQDGWLVLGLLLAVWVSDIGAYFVGTALGQKPGSIKIAPSISPKKSLWGLFGAVLFGIGTAVGLHFAGVLPFGLVHCAVVGLLASLGGLAGDLVESMWKRYFGVKDAGNLIPGHGGLYDRLDSAIIALPLVTLYLAAAGLL